MSGGRRKLAVALLAGFLLILVVVTIGNAESTISDLAAAGVRETRAHVWIWELSSVFAWLSVMPLIWWSVGKVRPPLVGWPAVALIALLGLPMASAWHVASMVALRHLAYGTMGEGYHFAGSIAYPYLYEFRKDVATYLQFTGLAALSQWVLASVDKLPRAEPNPAALSVEQPTLTIVDGATRHLLSVDTIDHIRAAGNYVEVHAAGRALLHRATLTGVETEMGDAFVRIHRSRLVRREAIRSVHTDRSGDFSVGLVDGTMLAGSRRYRDQLTRLQPRSQPERERGDECDAR
jgi:DNA-binding LytR/AlgR family response regulator